MTGVPIIFSRTATKIACPLLSTPSFSIVLAMWFLTVRGLNLKGEEVEIEAEGLLAIVLQHEIDHLNGMLFIDRLSKLKRDLYKRRRRKKLAKEQP